MQVSKESHRVRRMFAGISPRYDLLNHVLSLNVDRLWRRRAVRAVDLQPGEIVLDVCTGTGDLAIELAARAPKKAARVLASDFCPEMLVLGEEKRRRRLEDRLSFIAGDTLSLPFPDGVFDAATAAFGIRNLADLGRGLEEIRRVLKPGGRLAVLEFAMPRSRFLAAAYSLYFRQVLPRLGRWLSGQPAGGEAYAYLPLSVAEFPVREAFVSALEEAGFGEARYRALTGGIAVLYVARKPEEPPAEPVAAAAGAAEPRPSRGEGEPWRKL